ncbi:SirB2 family protein [Propionivibrio soli]|uniref:SirB2 family protein n=1 Tax=Propionivibrio soli TaxID=2976531 RepID=UPI0021E74C3C|nr:SirB2 family protein [Propionivibrio soli]
MLYLALRHIHITCVILSGTGFFIRGLGMLADSPWLNRRWVRIVPHIVDTVLLGSAIWLALLTHQYPLALDWLTAKVIALVVYVILGAMALRRGRTKSARAGYFVAALLTFGYIVSVALTRSPLGVFS